MLSSKCHDEQRSKPISFFTEWWSVKTVLKFCFLVVYPGRPSHSKEAKI